MWPGYLREASGQPLRAWLDQHGIPLVIHHASGHACIPDLQRLVAALAPERVVPIHSAAGAVPILGEIKVGGDADAYYAFVQLLTYLSELSSEAQTARASQCLFDGVVGFPARYDLHILLADYNDRGKKGPLVEATRSLVARFRAALSGTQAPQVLGRVLCLRMNTKAFTESLHLLWSE